jgi:hypothetical protein
VLLPPETVTAEHSVGEHSATEAPAAIRIFFTEDMRFSLDR